ncbi:nucleotidyltransferase family protein [Allocoprobacillus halotolerans]|uniref:Nucleotidyltransferase family protein n=1 Tax=Allocoprobacillus halotolerans TaxID=2944914 RepID=A0ABY5I0G2_9FIRM|nr:nucleotidyltransferase family protein [Allocoprobacillus halotolerans]UTY38410.1 nucleotidyltransferase family protein [Allocoprobacillus halotolerans]
MKILGLIVEYNPFHNGHIYHIQKAQSLDQFDYTIAIMSSSFVQRGEPAIIDKWKRSQIAIEYGIDLVIELPFVYACQSADYFAKGAIELLAKIGVTDICFGSENGEISTFIEIAQTLFEHQESYDDYVQQAMKKGYAMRMHAIRHYKKSCIKKLKPPMIYWV